MKPERKKILIVDDDPDYLYQMEMQVNRMGFEAIPADSEKEGMKVLEKMKPDLAILDLMMENADSGFILSNRIRKMYPGTPVILATAVTSETGMVFGLDEAGDKNWIKADSYLEKGIRPEQLRAEINRLMKT